MDKISVVDINEDNDNVDVMSSLSQKLSLRIEDPVENGNVDGGKYSANLRSQYLTTAYAIFKRKIRSMGILSSIAADNYYTKTYQSSTISQKDGSVRIQSKGKIHMVYAVDSNNQNKKVQKVDSSSMFSMLNNDAGSFRQINDNFYYSFLDGSLVLYPNKMKSVHILYSSADILLTEDISGYEDILLTLGTLEALKDNVDDRSINKMAILAKLVEEQFVLIAQAEKKEQENK